MAKKKAEDLESASLDSQLDAQLSSIGVQSLVQMAENFTDTSVECVSTGLPVLDAILHSTKLGLPMGRDTEVFSKGPSAGKTTLACQVVASFQRQERKTCIIEPEGTLTEDYLLQLEVETRRDRGKYAVRMVKHTGHNDPLYAEKIVDTIYKMGDIMDLIVVDSVAAMVPKTEFEKEMDGDAAKVAELGALMSRFMKRNTRRNAAIIWLNQSRMSPGTYSPQGTPMVTPGGKALDFYSSIRVELSMVERLKLNDTDPPIGMKVQALTIKNKVSPPYRKAMLTYINGDGFSNIFDYLDLGIQVGAIEKKGSWFSFGGEKLAQGRMGVYDALKQNAELFAAVMRAVDGEPAE